VKTVSSVVAKPRRLQKNEVELLKRTVAKGVSDDEFALFLWVCKKHKLDPMARQVHAVRRYVSKHHEEEEMQNGVKLRVWKPGFQMVIQIGIDGYRALAGRDHADFGGCDEPEFEFGEKDKRIPVLARIKLWKKGLEHPIVGVAYWDEYAPKDLAKAEAFMWNKMPKHMLAKCAEALALRKGYPELADIYTNEEMSQAFDEHTPEGRQIANGPNVDSGIRQQVLDEIERQAKEHAENMKALDAKNPATKKASCKSNSKAKGTSLGSQTASDLQETIWPKRES
jgi:phage recombination protein Bet